MRFSALALAIAIVGCGDNLTQENTPRDAAVDALLPDAAVLADLTLLGDQMDNSILITLDTFTADSCEVIEQCVGDVGNRQLLRFDAVTANIGTDDVVVGVPPPDGVNEGPWTWSPCHGHHHLSGYAIYELVDDDGVVLSGHKQAFCLQDSQQVRPGAPSQGYHCGMQGLSAGWADVYGRALPCQWVDITGVPSGTYTLRVRINPMGLLPDADPSNNEYRRTIDL